MGWSQFYTKDWTAAGTIASVGAGLTFTDNWTEVFGSIWSAGSNHLIGTSNNTGGDLTRLLTRPSSENKTNGRIVCVLDTNQTGIFSAILRRISANNQYQASFDPSNSRLTVAKVVSGIRTNISSAVNFSTTYNSAHTYTMDFSVQGINPTYISCTVTDDNTAVVVAELNAPYGGSDSESTLQVAGQFGISARSVSGSSNVCLIKTTTLYAGTLIAGQPSVSGTPTTAVLDYPTGGMGGTPTYTHDLHRATDTPDFTPSVSTLLDDNVTFPYTDSSLPAADRIFYKIFSTDSVAATATSKALIYEPWLAPLQLGLIGDSITGPVGGFDLTAELGLLRYRRTIVQTNMGVSGSTTADWQPGQANYVAAVAAFALASVTHISMKLGKNDAGSAVTAATYYTNMAAICTALTALGYKVLVHYPIGTTEEDHLALLIEYTAKINHLVQIANVSIGDKLGLAYFTQNQGELRQDGIHPTTQVGRGTLERLHAEAIERWLYDPTDGDIAAAVWSRAERTLTA